MKITKWNQVKEILIEIKDFIWKLCFVKDYKFMVSQNDPRKTQWEVFVIVLAIYNSFYIPFEISFEPDELNSIKFLIMNTIIDVMFGIDIFINFRTTFYHPVTGDEVSIDKQITPLAVQISSYLPPGPAGSLQKLV